MHYSVTPIDCQRAALFGSVDLFRELAEQSSDVLMLVSSPGCVGYVSPAISAMLGYAPGEIIGRHVLRFVSGDDAVRMRQIWSRVRLGEAREVTVECRVRNKSNGWQWLESRIRWLPGDSANAARWIASIRDVTERRQLEQRLIAEKARAQATLRAIADGVITVAADGSVDYLNPAAEKILGWSADAAMGQSVERIFQLTQPPRELPATNSLAAMAAWFHSMAGQPVSVRCQPTGDVLLQMAVASVADSDGKPQGLVLTFRDIAQTAGIVRELSFRSSHDALTGLLNREEFTRHLRRCVSEVSVGAGEHVMVMLDLDQFRLINESCGHAGGDALLRDVAAVLESSATERDQVARLGADEFGVLMIDCSMAEAIVKAKYLAAAIERIRFAWGERQFSTTVSIGLAPVQRGAGGHDSIIQAADAACFAAKEHGGNRVSVYSSSDVELVRRQDEMQWLPRLQTALLVGDFQLLAHDIVSTASARPDGRSVEVLIALPSASGRLIAPSEFLPVARRYGLMVRIDNWVLQQVIDWLQWRLASGRDLPTMVAVNLSGSSLCDPEFRAFAEERMRTLACPNVLCLEITDGEAITDFVAVNAFIARARALGCRFALDDFGSGLSSFAYLRRLPVDYVKIDGQFVRDASTDSVSLAMVDAIHRMSRVLGLQTIAESVENEATLRCMREVGVDYCQGYYFGMPKPLLVDAARPSAA